MFHAANLNINSETTKHFGIYFCILYHFIKISNQFGMN